MAETTQFRIGADASCSDGECGKVIRVVVDPIAEAVTHLVVEPTHREGLGRLVPLDLVDESDTESDTIHLTCTLAAFELLEHAEETHFLPTDAAYGAYAASQVFAMPYYGLGVGNISPPIVTDTIPLGEVGIRRGEPVLAVDGELGKVQGLIVDRATRHVTHVLLQEGHIWGRKEVAIPIAAVESTSDGIRLTITKQEVEDLPPVQVND